MKNERLFLFYSFKTIDYHLLDHDDAEAVIESAAVQESIQATVEELNISEELAAEIVENDAFYRDLDGNYISEAEA